MDFYAVLNQVVDLLRQRQRVTYRALQRQFQLDDAALQDLKDELLYAHPQVRDDEGRGLLWTGDAGPIAPPPATSVQTPEHIPLTYTPPYLAEKILTSRSALEGERKQVTVLFCDLANSTPIAERIGPEAMHTLLNRFFEVALHEVHRYEGTINQFLEGVPPFTRGVLGHEIGLVLARELRPLVPGHPLPLSSPQHIQWHVCVGRRGQDGCDRADAV